MPIFEKKSHLIRPVECLKLWVLQGVLSQSVQDESVLREGRKDISDILEHFFSRKHMHVLISKLTFMKKKWEIRKNHKIC